ncbi:MAG: hypothetical protein BGO82_06990 [Devosia sp. 67-54]|uniref:DUF1223 domain-containing protein n=1 Tax=unclassified Devosia TaxID=196773 RepID=UPI00096308F3|nr:MULTISPECIES: DUF1223 domain-containing protein [unclassified Devosia]MBN9307058.1 DUF1223 domain-containing protein [Devosia sp.]OJX19470.1 MAG: hypothetical protein BGO82_06990 [Devosia sp. 67-54]
MKSLSLLPVAAATLLAAGSADAAELRSHPKAVLELFTSQGCSSCPQADLKFSELSKRDDLITLAYHVDYWDYIGWVDTFGSKDNTDRQKAYAQSWGKSMIYTPELVVNGAKGVVGSRQKDVDDALGTAALSVPVGLDVAADMLKVTVAPQTGGTSAMVWLVTFKDHAEVVIGRGENAGKTVDYTQIVTGRQMLGMWDPAAGTHWTLPLSELQSHGSNGAVILVQAEKSGLPGAIVGAASIKL